MQSQSYFIRRLLSARISVADSSVNPSFSANANFILMNSTSLKTYTIHLVGGSLLFRLISQRFSFPY